MLIREENHFAISIAETSINLQVNDLVMSSYFSLTSL